MPRAVIFANGTLPDLQRAHGLLDAHDVILCANGGYRHVRSLGLRPHTVIGDMDSLSKEELAKLSQEGVQINLHPPDKDQSDLELALRFAADSNFDPLLIVGGLGGRTDQVLANLGLLASPALASRQIRMDDGVEEILVCRERCVINGQIGDTVSLIPWGGVAGGIETENLKWPLKADYRTPEETRGLSNVMLAETASISVSFGMLLIAHRRQESTPVLRVKGGQK